jgi:hypothetical protein
MTAVYNLKKMLSRMRIDQSDENESTHDSIPLNRDCCIID